MKKLSLVLAMILLFTACGGPVDINTEEGAAKVEEKVEEALFDYHRDMYDDLQCDGVGFVIMGQEEVEGEVKVYTICSYGAYEERDGAMCKNQGHACIPMVVTLDAENLKPVKVEEPEDSERYYESAEELFPEDYHERIFNLSIDDFTAVSGMETDMISKYLEKKGLEMVIKY